jgi:AcrR family transcriptional regulator
VAHADEETRKANRGPAAGPENRRALIAAAREVYATEGLNAPFSAVAKRAGVGQGSLYRHFPDRKALAVAVFEENLVDIEEFTRPWIARSMTCSTGSSLRRWSRRPSST